MKKVLFSSILSLVLCLSLIAGGTFALFTSEQTTNISVNSGTVKLTAKLENLALYSPSLINADGTIPADATNAAKGNTFANGGTALLSDSQNIALDKMTPGDYVTFDVVITNHSNVAVNYRTAVDYVNDTGLFAGLKVTVNGIVLTGPEAHAWKTLAGGEQPETTVLKVKVELPTTAGDTYQSTGTELVFAVYGVQANAAREDMVFANNDTTLGEAVNNSADGTTVVLGEGTYDMEKLSLTNREILFSGNENTVFDQTNMQIGYTNNMAGSTLVFDGVTIKFSGNNEGYQGLKNVKKVIYKNCTLIGTQFLYGEAEFINCTLISTTGYNVWTYGQPKATFVGCTFNTGGRAILIYNEAVSDSFVANITVTDCVFNSTGTDRNDKAVIETGSNSNNAPAGNRYNITITNCTSNGFVANNSTSPLWGNKNSMDTNHLNVILDGVDVY